MPLFQLEFFILYQAPHSRALAPTCGALVFKWGLSDRHFMSNPLPDDKIFQRSKFKQIADNIFEVHLKRKISAIYGRKNCEKRRNRSLQAISPFCTMFSTAIYL